jgi:hypothetical protein
MLKKVIKSKSGKLFNSNLIYKSKNKNVLRTDKNKLSKDKFKNRTEMRFNNNCLYTYFLEDFWSNKLKLDKNHFIVKKIIDIVEKATEERETLNSLEFNKIKELGKKTGCKITKKDILDFQIELETEWFYMTKLVFDKHKSKYNNIKQCEFHMNNLEKIIDDVKIKQRVLNSSEMKYFNFVQSFIEENKLD